MKQNTNPRWTIGLVTAGTDPRGQQVWLGVAQAARERDLNLICFPVDGSHSIYPLLRAERVDGFIVSRYIERADFEELAEWCRPRPMVTIWRAFEGYHYVDVDNYGGMRQAVAHLIRVHSCRRIAFVQGMTGNVSAQIRYRAYIDELAAHGLTVDPQLVVPGEFTFAAGAQAARTLIDVRKVHFDALVAGNDQAALGAMEALLERGVRVPADVAVVGFDDVAAAALATSPLTTVRQPWRRWGGRAVEVLAALLAGEKLPEKTVLPVELVVRRSCGCLAPEVQLAGETTPADLVSLAGAEPGGSLALAAHRESILQCVGSELAGVALQVPEGPIACVPADRERLFDAFVASLEAQGRTTESKDVLLDVLEEMLIRWFARRDAAPVLPDLARKEGASEIERSVGPWQQLISALRRHCRPFMAGDAELLQRAENLWDRARVLIQKRAELYAARDALYARQQSALLDEVGQALLASFDLKKLSDVLVQRLPELGIGWGSVALYGENQDWANLMAAFTGNKAISFLAGRRFSSLQLVPDGVLPTDSCYSAVVEPLDFGPEHMGFALFEFTSHQTPLTHYSSFLDVPGLNLAPAAEVGTYHALRLQLSAALQAALLLQQRQRAEADLEKRLLQMQTAAEVGRMASGVLDVDTLAQQGVDLVLRELDLYYVGLFLVDEDGAWTGEAGRWAMLRAGTGQAGRQMRADDFKLEVGGASMVGQCIASGKARIALDVGQQGHADQESETSSPQGRYSVSQVVRFDNPLLPHTHSELALPLISRGQPIGAMTIQSTQESAFERTDIAALQLVADQLANAIQTVRSLAAAQQGMERTQTLYETSRVLSTTLEETPLMRAILEGLWRRMGCEYAIISVVDQEARTMESRHGLWRGEYDVFPEWMRMSKYSLDQQDILVDVYRTAQTEVIAGWDDRFNREIYERFGHERLLRVFMPIQLRDRVTGVIEVAYDREQKRQITGEEIDLLRAFVDQAAVALENARLFRQTQVRAGELAVLNEMSRTLTSRLSVREVLDTVYRGVSHLLGVPNFFVGLYDAECNQVTFPLDMTEREDDRLTVMPADQGLTGYIIRNRTGVLIKEDLAEHLAALGIEQVGTLAQSWLGVPMMLGDQVLGVMCAQNYTTRYAFDEHDQELMSALANQAAAALENARLFEEAELRARREGSIRQIADRMQNAVDLESLMRITTEELVRALGASRAYVRMRVGAEPVGHVKGDLPGVPGSEE